LRGNETGEHYKSLLLKKRKVHSTSSHMDCIYILSIKKATMHLEKAIEIGKEAGLETDEECVGYIFQHAKELFSLENLYKEICELADEAEKEGLGVPGRIHTWLPKKGQ
jgi:hypothetical protein